MTLTLFALSLVPFYLKMVLDPQGTDDAMKEIRKHPAAQILFSFVLVLMGLILMGHASLLMGAFTQLGLLFDSEFNRVSIMAWLGLLVFIKGAALLSGRVWKWNDRWFKVKHYPMLGFVGLLFVLALVYLDLQVLL